LHLEKQNLAQEVDRAQLLLSPTQKHHFKTRQELLWRRQEIAQQIVGLEKELGDWLGEHQGFTSMGRIAISLGSMLVPTGQVYASMPQASRQVKSPRQLWDQAQNPELIQKAPARIELARWLERAKLADHAVDCLDAGEDLINLANIAKDPVLATIAQSQHLHDSELTPDFIAQRHVQNLQTLVAQEKPSRGEVLEAKNSFLIASQPYFSLGLKTQPDHSLHFKDGQPTLTMAINRLIVAGEIVSPGGLVHSTEDLHRLRSVAKEHWPLILAEQRALRDVPSLGAKDFSPAFDPQLWTQETKRLQLFDHASEPLRTQLYIIARQAGQSLPSLQKHQSAIEWDAQTQKWVAFVDSPRTWRAAALIALTASVGPAAWMASVRGLAIGASELQQLISVGAFLSQSHKLRFLAQSGARLAAGGVADGIFFQGAHNTLSSLVGDDEAVDHSFTAYAGSAAFFTLAKLNLGRHLARSARALKPLGKLGEQGKVLAEEVLGFGSIALGEEYLREGKVEDAAEVFRHTFAMMAGLRALMLPATILGRGHSTLLQAEARIRQLENDYHHAIMAGDKVLARQILDKTAPP
jgi:hypothetical protein